ncbi:MAG: hypothetical protein SVG88_05465 [Halobacteriales archaeon]|nr:hypothetical protein [Halobacteriales archaeon]
MVEDVELPNGDVIEPGDVILYNDYPYRLVSTEATETAFILSPLYWGDSALDIPFESRDELVAQWEADSRGLLTEEEWRDWLREARGKEMFTAEELDTIETIVIDSPGLLARIRSLLRGD